MGGTMAKREMTEAQRAALAAGRAKARANQAKRKAKRAGAAFDEQPGPVESGDNPTDPDTVVTPHAVAESVPRRPAKRPADTDATDTPEPAPAPPADPPADPPEPSHKPPANAGPRPKGIVGRFLDELALGLGFGGDDE